MSLQVWGIPSPPRMLFCGVRLFRSPLPFTLIGPRADPSRGSKEGFQGPAHKRLFPPHSAPPRPDPAASPKHAGNVSGCSRQTASTWYLSPNMEPVSSEWGGRGWGAQWASLGREGLVGRLRGDITALAPFKPLTQPAPHPVCPAQALTLLSFKPRNDQAL